MHRADVNKNRINRPETVRGILLPHTVSADLHAHDLREIPLVQSTAFLYPLRKWEMGS